jgi:hypothetical protein
MNSYYNHTMWLLRVSTAGTILVTPPRPSYKESRPYFVVTETVRGLPGKLHFRVNLEALYARMLELEKGHPPSWWG